MKAAVLGLAVGLCLMSAPAFGQGGLELTLGAGTGSGTINCSACSHAGNMPGTTYSIQVVQRVSPYVRVGWTLDTWSHARDDWERAIGALNAVVFYYPSSVHRSGLFIGGGPSYSIMVASVTDSTGLQRHGWGFAAELGYDIVPRKEFSLTPYFQYSYAWVGDVYYPKGSGIPFARGWKHQVVSVGLGVTYHERPKHDQ
jgi:hypothetical protein